MTRYLLRSLQVEGFRGINNKGAPLRLSFDARAVNSIFAANGLGKSSLYEALCYAIRGDIPKLTRLEKHEKPTNYYGNRFHGGTATVALELESDTNGETVTILVERTSSGQRRVTSPSGHPDPAALLTQLNSELVLLDYDTFEQFIADSALARGRTFSSLLGLSRLSEARQAIDALAHKGNLETDLEITSLKKELASLKERKTDCENQIVAAFRDVTGTELSPPLDMPAILESAARAFDSTAVEGSFTGHALDSVDIDATRSSLQALEQSDKRAEYRGACKNVERLKSLEPETTDTPAPTDFQAAAARKDAAAENAPAVSLRALYRSVISILESDDWSDDKQCPACNSQLDAPLKPELKNRLGQFDELQAAENEIEQLWGAHPVAQRIATLVTDNEIGGEEAQRAFNEAQTKFKNGESTAPAALTELLESLESKLTDALKAATLLKETLEKELPPSFVRLTQKLEQAALLKRAAENLAVLPNAETLDRRIKEREAWADFIGRAKDVFSGAESEFSTKRTQDIETTYRSLYADITRTPEVLPSLKKSPGSENLNLVLEDFFGLKNEAARGLLPESFRNSLAISIFLAAALEARPTARFIVLDDVTSSFDAGHQFHLMEALRHRISLPHNPDGLQVVLMTHDGLLQKYLEKVGGAGWRHQKLTGLPPKGSVTAQVDDGSSLQRQVESFLQAGQTDVATPLMRQYLESQLLRIIRKVDILVSIDFAIRDDRKMVSNALGAIHHAIELHDKAGDLVLDATGKQAIETILTSPTVGNLASHYATASTASLSPHFLLGVLKEIDDLTSHFQYRCSCGPRPAFRFYRDLTSKFCNC